MKATILLYFFFSLAFFLVSCQTNQNPLIVRLDVDFVGLGEGSIVGLNEPCESDCNDLFRQGERVSLRAQAKQGSRFVGWQGACSGQNNCSFTLQQNETLQAIFEPDGALLKLELLGAGSVTAESLACSENCDLLFTNNEVLELKAVAAEGFTFVGWQGACTGFSCTLSMNSSKLVIAEFKQIKATEQYLFVSKLGSGSGVVSSETNAIRCGETCSSSFPEATVVRLSAEALQGSRFVAWQGACAGLSDCVVSMAQEQHVTAVFERTSSQGDLMINELATAPQGQRVWLELYNASSSSIDLSDYSLRALAVNQANTQTQLGDVLFRLPARVLAPDSFLVLFSKTPYQSKDGPQHVYLPDLSNASPYWGESGFVELVREGKTIDFVRYGSNATLPLSSAWSVHNLPALTGRLASSLSRNAEGVWQLTEVATLAGPNDVMSAQDDDKDGIPDSAEVLGGSFAGLDLYAMGARVNQRDIFVEIDFMQSNDEGVKPQREALDMIVAAFAKQNIALHFDVGTTFSSSFSLASYNLGAANSQVPFAKSITIPSESYALGSKANFYDYKAEYMDLRRLGIFHYALFANSFNEDGGAGPSGLAELNGNDLIVTQGGWNLNKKSEENKNMLINFQAGTLMHELGHNLGLRHGGFENQNNKPNYLSVMNYQYQLFGIGASQANVGDRYYAYRRWRGFGTEKDICDLTFSPCSTSFKLDFSDGSSADLNEAQLNESMGLGRQQAWLDFDNSGHNNRPSFDVNANQETSILKDHNDWANIQLSFNRSPNGLSLQSNTSFAPLQQDQQEWIIEQAPAFLNAPHH